ncbi:MAG: carbohydrate kinase [Nodosilinea sp.]
MVIPRVLCLGEILVDRLADQPGLPLEAVRSWSDFPGGAPANVACALAKLGTAAGFIGCVGQDTWGQTLEAVLQQAGVDITGLQRHPTAPTRSVYVLRSATGDREFAGFGPHPTAAFADTHLRAAALPEALFETADYLVLGTLGLAHADSRGAIERALALAASHGLRVVMDVNWRPRFWPQPDQAAAMIWPHLPQVDLLKLSKEEALWLFDTVDPEDIAASLPQAMGVVITDGAQGCIYSVAGHRGACPAFEVAVIDTTGAGDSFVAGLVHQLGQIEPEDRLTAAAIDQIMRYASAVGALTTLKAGAIAAQPTAQAVHDFLA